MGIYPTTDRGPAAYNMAAGLTEWDEYRRTPGLVEVRHVTATPWATQERTDCFCCSCPAGGVDHYCRNHGGSAGQRPCETHGMPGDDGLATAQQYRKEHP